MSTTVTMRDEPTTDLSPEDFRAWLSRWPGFVVGEPGDIYNNPVMNWMRVTGRYKPLGTPLMPPWAITFNERLDAYAWWGEEPITGRVAIAILDEMTEDLAPDDKLDHGEREAAGDTEAIELTAATHADAADRAEREAAGIIYVVRHLIGEAVRKLDLITSDKSGCHGVLGDADDAADMLHAAGKLASEPHNYELLRLSTYLREAIDRAFGWTSDKVLDAVAEKATAIADALDAVGDEG